MSTNPLNLKNQQNSLRHKNEVCKYPAEEQDAGFSHDTDGGLGREVCLCDNRVALSVLDEIHGVLDPPEEMKTIHFSTVLWSVFD
jgi:hypothetical protein